MMTVASLSRFRRHEWHQTYAMLPAAVVQDVSATLQERAAAPGQPPDGAAQLLPYFEDIPAASRWVPAPPLTFFAFLHIFLRIYVNM